MSDRDPAAVEAMFDRIAPRYDLVNSVLSGGADGRWRRRAAGGTGVRTGAAALDIACGSGRLSAALASIAGPGGLVVGLDFSERMLAVARHRYPSVRFTRGDALALPFGEAAFDATTMAFGLRNLADPELGLREMARVLKPGGRAVVLEFVRPRRGPIGGAYRLYLTRVLPAIGGALSGDGAAYRYLSETVDAYRTPAQLVDLARGAGWGDVRFQSLTLGTVGLLSGQRQ